MTHYSLLVRYEGEIKEFDNRIEKMLEPYFESENAKFDYFAIGGSYKDMLLLKDIKPSGSRYSSDSVDFAYAKDVDFEGFYTVAVLDKDGFHEPKDSFDKKEMDAWAKDFQSRFLSDISDRTVLVVVDLHI